MKRLPLLASLIATTSLGAVAALSACGGISDPTRGSSSERVATVSGALTGTSIPSNTRVALVWKVAQTNTYAVSSDVAVVGGKFTMDLSAPPDSYFTSPEGDYTGLSAGGGESSSPVADEPPSVPGSSTSGSSGGGGGAPRSGGQSFAFANNVAPRDTVSGQINQPLSVAVAGFVVYVDTNGNGKLDIEGQWAKATDQVIGGNKELFLAYLRDGGSLDYEKLRDKSGILPHTGYNLAWDQGRWLPLNVVELKILADSKLPSAVCSTAYSVDEASPRPLPSSSSSGSSGSDSDSVYGYPDPSDPNLRCSPDGRSWSYSYGCEDPTPPPVGLCAPSYDVVPPTACAGGGAGLGPNDPIPDGWPCPVAQDAGPPPDPTDAGPGPDNDAGI